MGKGKGKKKIEGDSQVLVPSTMDQGSQMQAKSYSRVKRKAILLELMEDMITQGT